MPASVPPRLQERPHVASDDINCKYILTVCSCTSRLDLLYCSFPFSHCVFECMIKAVASLFTLRSAQYCQLCGKTCSCAHCVLGLCGRSDSIKHIRSQLSIVCPGPRVMSARLPGIPYDKDFLSCFAWYGGGRSLACTLGGDLHINSLNNMSTITTASNATPNWKRMSCCFKLYLWT